MKKSAYKELKIKYERLLGEYKLACTTEAPFSEIKRLAKEIRELCNPNAPKQESAPYLYEDRCKCPKCSRLEKEYWESVWPERLTCD